MHGAFHLNRPCVARLPGLNSILKPSPIVVQEPTSSDGGTCCSLSRPRDSSFPSRTCDLTVQISIAVARSPLFGRLHLSRTHADVAIPRGSGRARICYCSIPSHDASVGTGRTLTHAYPDSFAVPAASAELGLR